MSPVRQCLGIWQRGGGLGYLSVRLPTPRCRGVWAAYLRPSPGTGRACWLVVSTIWVLPACPRTMGWPLASITKKFNRILQDFPNTSFLQWQH